MADLKQKINTLDLAEQSRVMREHNRERLHDATVKWVEALSRIEEHGGSTRQIPEDFDDAMQIMYGLSHGPEVGESECKRLSAVDLGRIPRGGADFGRRSKPLTTAIAIGTIQ
jgi:hypothetical protein